MKIACTALVAIAGTLTFTGNAAAFDRGLQPANNAATRTLNGQTATGVTTGTRVFDASNMVLRDRASYNPFHTTSTLTQALPIALGDCGVCDSALIDNNYAPLSGAVEPVINLTGLDPAEFATAFYQFFPTVGSGFGFYVDPVNDYLNFSDGQTFFGVPNVGTIPQDASTLAEITGPSTICGFSGFYPLLDSTDTDTLTNFAESDSFYISDTQIDANGNIGLLINFTGPVTLFFERNRLNPGDPNGIATATFIQEADGFVFGACQSDYGEFDLADLRDNVFTPGQGASGDGFVITIVPDFDSVAPQVITPASDDYSIEFYADEPLGACCLNGAGTEILAQDCINQGGVFYGIGSVLSAAPDDGGVECEMCDLDSSNSFYETSIDNLAADGVSTDLDVNAGCDDVTATNTQFNTTLLDLAINGLVPVDEAILENRWVGTAYNYINADGAGVADVDYYTFKADADATITVSVESDVPIVFFAEALGTVVNDDLNDAGSDPCGPGFAILDTAITAATADTDDCTGTLIFNVFQDQYYAISVQTLAQFGLVGQPTFQGALVDPLDFLGLNFSAVEADDSSVGNRYAFTANAGAPQTGACCFLTTATDEFEQDCIMAGGDFQGPGTLAADGLCCPDPWVVGATDENENEVCSTVPVATASDSNDGCDASGDITETIPLAEGQIINGESTVYTSLSNFLFADFDAYAVTLPGGDVDVSMSAQFNLSFELWDANGLTCVDGDLDPANFLGFIDITTTGCAEGFTLSLIGFDAGDYIFRITSTSDDGQFFGDPEAGCDTGINLPLRYSLEWNPAAPACQDGCTDITGDGVVDISDLLALLAQFNNPLPGSFDTSDPPRQVDINCDEVVDITDLLELLTQFNEAAPAVCN